LSTTNENIGVARVTIGAGGATTEKLGGGLIYSDEL